MAKQKLTALDLRLKKLAVLSQAYTDDKAAGEKVYLYDSAVEHSGTTEGYLKTYYLAAGAAAFSAITNDNLIGTIDIPKDYLVKEAHMLDVEDQSGTLVVVKVDGQTPQQPYAKPDGVTSAGSWLDFIINVASGTTTDSHVCINVSELVDVYTAGNGINISGSTISIDLAANGGLEFSGDTKLKAKVNEENGLSITESGITMSLATYDLTTSGGTSGAMTSDDKRVVEESNTDLLIDNELGSWFGLNSGQTHDILSGVTDDSITDDPTPPGPTPTVNLVDLGLPSGNLWADRNVGASSVEDFGLYFSWGNTTGQAISEDATFGEPDEYGAVTVEDAWDDGYSFDTTTYNSTAGAALSADLTSANDAAAVNMGGSWVMPSKTDFEELFNSEYTTQEFTTQNGVNGLLITSLSNGNTLFLPAAGNSNGTSLNGVVNYGYYWSSSYNNDSSTAYCLYFDSNGSFLPSYNNYRNSGSTVRAVQKGSNS